MIVTYVTDEAKHTLHLPAKVYGRYWLQDRLISIEGVNGTWLIRSNRKATLLNDKATPLYSVELNPHCRYSLRLTEPSRQMAILTEPRTLDRQQYIKYCATYDTQLRIGKNPNSDIVINHAYVSDDHAQLNMTRSGWSIVDNSTNGTFVNGLRVTQPQILKTGDQVALVGGFQIIIGTFFIAMNNPDQSVTVATPHLSLLKPSPMLPGSMDTYLYMDDDDEEEDNLVANNYLPPFSRSPRFRRTVSRPVITVETPPQNQIGEETPLMLTLGPSMTMGMGSGIMMIFAVNSALSSGNWTHAIPSIAMAFCMMTGVVLWPILSKRFDKKRRREKEALRQSKFTDYIQSVRDDIRQECAKQEKILHRNAVSIDTCTARILDRRRTLWDRGPGQPDFLVLRLGLGDLPLDADINYPENRFALEDDNLRQDLETLRAEPKILHSVPITLSLTKDYICGIIGERLQAISLAKGLIIQLAALFSFDEVKLVFLYDPQDEAAFGFTKWLPHVWNNGRTMRFLATTPSEAKEISAYLEQEIEYRARQNDQSLSDSSPYYIIFSLSHTLAQSMDMLKHYTTHKKNLNISVLTFYDKLAHLPKESTLVIEMANPTAAGELTGELADDQDPSAEPATFALKYYNSIPATGKLYNRDDPTGVITLFAPDIHVPADPKDLSLRLANIQLDTQASAFRLPAQITLLELFGVGNIEHLNPLARWQENDPTKTLEAPIGIDTLGNLHKLDLHEKFHGPHGLIAGMTGSGKSEFIMTFILSLAINYHPYEVAFIFIDYKGGGMAKAFAHLPHTAGIITNLDGPAIKRSLISIQSELKRRQAIFAKTSEHLNISNIDIYKYQEFYRRGTVTEPLQHLILIADEFAELKTQQPEFMTELISAARIGRSLGVHLILATQKPSGVVNDQIWSNSRFRICLKVQDKADSTDMLKRPDAAEIIEPGRYYLQVGYNEVFQMGQSAWAGAPYYPSDKVLTEKDNAVTVIDRNGHPLRAAKPNKHDTRQANPPKQLDAVTNYLRTIARKENIQIQPLWLDPIEPTILLSDIRTKYNITPSKEPYILNPLIGEYDDPANQRQGPLTLPLTDEGNAIVYGSEGSGKTTFINTLITSLMEDRTPSDLTLYLLDFGAETLRAFIQAPHVSDVVLSYESEKIANLFSLLQEEIAQRKKRFADYGGSHASYMQTAPEDPLPAILTVIHNYAAFHETYENQHQNLIRLTREGAKYGIYFVLTASSTLSVRYYLEQNFKQLFALQLNDPSEYHRIVGKTEGRLPAKHKGRGLVKIDDIYEYQIAHITQEPIPFSFIQTMSESLRQAHQGSAAPEIPVIPAEIDIDFLLTQISTSTDTTMETMELPIGIECDTLHIAHYPLAQHSLHFVISSQEEQSHPFLYALAQLIKRRSGTEVIVINPGGTHVPKDTTLFTHVTTPEDILAALTHLSHLITQRNATRSATDSDSGPGPDPNPGLFDPIIVIITAYSRLRQSLSEDDVHHLLSMMDKSNTACNITILCGEHPNNLGQVRFTTWYQTHYPQQADTCIWIGPGLKEQYTFTLSNRFTSAQANLPPGHAFRVIQGNATRVKILRANTEEETPS